MPDDEHSVFDLSIRRKPSDDPVIQLADKLSKLIAKQDGYGLRPEDQLAALELTTRAVLEAVRHAKGASFMLEVSKLASVKARSYQVEWPDHDQSRTVYDSLERPKNAEVIPLSRRDKKDG